MVLARRNSPSALLLGVLASVGLALALSTTSAMAAACANEQLRKESNVDPTTGQPYSTELPDCRAYEMVSPVEKQGHGAGVGVSNNGPNVLPIAVAPTGEPVGWSSEGDFLEPENFDVTRESPLNGYLSRRGESGWTASSAFAPRSLVDGPSPNGGGLEGDLSLDLSSEHVSCGTVPTGEGERGGEAASLACALQKDGGEWERSPLYTTVAGNQAGGETYLGASADLSRVFFQPKAPLQLEIGEDKSSFSKSGGIYEVAGMGTGSRYLRLVNVNNGGGELLTVSESGQLLGPLIGAARNNPRVYGSSYHAISEVGGVFFTAQPPGSPILTLYARIHCVHTTENEPTCKEDGNGEYLETVNVSNPTPSECTVTGTVTGCPKACTAAEEVKLGATLAKEECQGLKPATFEGASADGSKVFFTTKQRLLSSDTYETADLYEYDFKAKAGENLIQISAGEAGQPVPGGAEVKGVLRTATDGSHVYFVAGGVLTTEKNGSGEQAVKGQSNLYGYDTVTHKTRFIATTSLKPGAFDVEEPVTAGSTSKIEEDDVERKVQVTPDGKDLVFSSPVKLAGNTNENAKKEPVEAVYRYDFETGELTWVSHAAPRCARPECAPEAGTEAYGAYVAARPGDAPYSSGPYADVEDWNRAVSGLKVGEGNEEYVDQNDGEYIIFTTRQQLQKNDADGGVNVYEWHCSSPCNHPGGEGEGPGEGTVHMISDGHDSERGVAYSEGATEAGATMSATGSDILFTTDTRLVGQDTDVMRDVYDARIGGGFAAPPPQLTCSGEPCQGSSSVLPTFGPSPSSESAAAGNLTSAGSGTLAFQTTKPKPKPLTQAEKLAKALKACKGKPKKKRAACDSQARKKYPTKTTKAKKNVKAKKSDRRGN